MKASPLVSPVTVLWYYGDTMANSWLEVVLSFQDFTILPGFEV